MHRVVARGNFPQVFVLRIHKSYFPICLFGGQQLPNFYPVLTEQGFNASSWTCTTPHIWWVATAWLWLYSQVPSQQAVLDVLWKNSFCFSFFFPYHSRERKMRIQLEMGRRWKKTDVIEKKSIQLRSNLDWEFQSLNMAEHSYTLFSLLKCRFHK